MIRSVVLGLVLGGGSSALSQEKPFDMIRGARVHGVVITPQTRFKLETVTSTLVGFGMSGRAGEGPALEQTTRQRSGSRRTSSRTTAPAS